MSLPALSRRLLTWIALGLATGCGTENNDEVFGIYSLVGVKGSPLPYLESSEAQRAGDLEFEAEIQGFGTLRFSGSANPLESFVTVPPIPPATGPDLRLQFAIVS